MRRPWAVVGGPTLTDQAGEAALLTGQARDAALLATRGFGEVALLSSLPGPVVVLFAVVTQLGDPWFVFALLTLLYWRPAWGFSRPRAALLLALGVLVATLIVAAKVGFALPRPPGAATASAPAWLPAPLDTAFVDAASDEDFGFPSGHGAAAAVVYGGLAALSERRSRRRDVAAASVVGAVGLSRIVLELHYLVDVVAGIALGLGALGVGIASRRREWPVDGNDAPALWFGVAAAVALGGVGLAAARGLPVEVHESVVALGSAIGGAAGWGVVRRTPGASAVAVPGPVAIGAAIVAGGAWAGAYAAASLPHPVAALVSAAAIGGVVVLPAAVARR